jgi:hypothetical protein
MPLARVAILVLGIVAKRVGRRPWIRRGQRRREVPLDVGDKPLRACQEIGGRIDVALECCGIRPDRHLEIILRILASGRDRIPIESVAGPNDRLRIECPCDTNARSPVVFDRTRSEEGLPCQDHAAEVWIREECVRNTWRAPSRVAQRRHLAGADDPMFVRQIESIPEASIESLRLGQIVISQPRLTGQIWPSLSIRPAHMPPMPRT